MADGRVDKLRFPFPKSLAPAEQVNCSRAGGTEEKGERFQKLSLGSKLMPKSLSEGPGRARVGVGRLSW